ncbi:MAG: diphosphatase [Frankiales bacterium]|nr:diphosphatase [Frankiales bacterium]
MTRPARDVPALSRSTVDRDGATRTDDAALAEAWESARVLVVDDGLVRMEGPALRFVRPDQAPDGDRLYLGRDDDGPVFAVAGPLPPGPGGTPGLRDVGARLSDRDAGLLSHAVGLVNWHAAHPFCPRCGQPLTAVRGGAERVCPQGHTQHPRTDPAIIVLVTDGADRCVLGRQAVWPERRFSTLAGFVEPGESLEQAVVREVGEESGVACRDVVYRGSQPWPFPQSLMLGFRAVCDGDAQPVCRDGELAEVAWFTRDEVLAAGGWSDDAVPGLLLPPPVSIAHRLITEWAAEVRTASS